MSKRSYTTIAVVSLVTLGAALGLAAAIYYTQQRGNIGSYDGESPLFI